MFVGLGLLRVAVVAIVAGGWVGDFVGEVGGEKDDGFLGGVGADFFEGLEGADVDTAGGLCEHAGGFGDGGSGTFLAFGGNDSGAALALGFGLFSHGAFHVGREFDVLELDAFDVDTPFVGLSVDDFADLGGNFVAFTEDFVEVEVAGDVAEGGLGESAGGVGKISSFEDGFAGVDDAEIDNRVDVDGDVVAGDDLLFRDVHRGRADVDFDHFVDVGNDNSEAGVEGARIATEAEDDAALELVNNADAGQNNNCGKNKYNN